MENGKNSFSGMLTLEDQIDWLVENPTKHKTLWLDNDAAFVEFLEDEEADMFEPFYWGEPVELLFKKLGIRADSV